MKRIHLLAYGIQAEYYIPNKYIFIKNDFNYICSFNNYRNTNDNKNTSKVKGDLENKIQNRL